LPIPSLSLSSARLKQQLATSRIGGGAPDFTVQGFDPKVTLSQWGGAS
jgi:hypothetical protein